MANNHSMDYGLNTQRKTYNSIIQENMFAIGTLENPIKKFVINNYKVAFIGASPHSNTYSIFNSNLIVAIHELKDKGYIVIVSLHMGNEGIDKYYVKDENEVFLGQNRGNIYRLSHKLIDNGAALIVGHGPHVLRGIEVYKNKIIAYSLGNFLTYGSFSLSDKLSYGGILSVSLDKNGNFINGKFIGTQQLKSIDKESWSKGLAIMKNKESMNWLKKISYENFQQNSIKFDNDGNLYK